MILKELTTDHYVVVDDSEIKVGDWFLPISGIGWELNNPKQADSGGGYNNNHCKRITHSTDISWIEIDYIPLSEVKELLGEVDVEKNMWYERNVQNPYSSDSLLHTGFNKGFELGYNQALEDNKDRKYTEEDLRNAYRHGTTVNHGTKEHFNSFIQSFQSKTEWEVEFDEQGKLRLK